MLHKPPCPLQAAGRKAYISTFKKLADKYKDRPFS
jgi:hypothetical protein